MEYIIHYIVMAKPISFFKLMVLCAFLLEWERVILQVLKNQPSAKKLHFFCFAKKMFNFHSVSIPIPHFFGQIKPHLLLFLSFSNRNHICKQSKRPWYTRWQFSKPRIARVNVIPFAIRRNQQAPISWWFIRVIT